MPLITFEGMDGVGKSTLIRNVSDALAAHAPVVLREPGGTLLGDQLRAMLRASTGAEPTPECELMLFAGARHQLIHERIRPALLEGRVVLLDRFTDSTVAYQAYGRELDLDTVLRVCRFAAAGVTPAMTVLLQMDEAARLSRVKRRGAEDRFERAGRAFDLRVAEGYAAVARAEPERFLILDGADEPGALCDQVIDALAQRAIATVG